MKRIACAGDSCVDSYDELGIVYPGGNPVNVAVYIRRLGGEVSFVGAVGDDAFGEIVTKSLKRKGIDISHVQELHGLTPVSYVRTENGNRIFVDYDEGIMTDYVPTEDDLQFLLSHDLVVSDLWGHLEPYLGRIRDAGVPVAYDCADLPFCKTSLLALPHTDIAFFSDDEASDRKIRQLIRKVASYGPKIVVAMRGATGSIAFDGRRYHTCAAVPCEVVDTLGAGDSFIAGFLLAHLNGKPIRECMQLGAENAAVTISYRGAWE